MWNTEKIIQKIYIKKSPSLKPLNINRWKNATAGRSGGKITVRHKGGGVSRNYRLLDNKRALWNVDGFVHSFEYDPGRSALLAVIYYPECSLTSYIIAPSEVQVGDKIQAGDVVSLKTGNATLLRFISLRLRIHNVEGHPGQGAKYCRSAGSWAMILSKSKTTALLAFSNGKKKEFSLDCLATIGVVGNLLFNSEPRKLASYYRKKGVRPTVRGVAMNPVDHPHGGGNGKKSPKSVSMSPWRKLGKGIKTKKK